MSKAFITGITGMVGSHLLDYLIANTTWEIHGLIRWRSSLENIKQHIPSINKGERIFLHYGDINDYASLCSIFDSIKFDYVFHLAAQSYPKTSFSSPIDTLNTNIIGTVNLLESLRKSNSDAVIHVCASSEVFGRVRREELPIHEDVHFHPASPYAISKVGTDLVGRFYGEAYGLKVVTTRMFTHTGPRRGDVFAESTFAKQIAMIEKGLKPKVIHVGNLESLRTWADVRDAVRAYYLLVISNPKPGDYFNIGGTTVKTVGEMLDKLLEFSKVKDVEILVEESRLRPIDADLQIPDMTKFQQLVDWKPEYSFETTMRDLLNYWRNKIKDTGEYLNR
jgi:GDPmannose 4,6-dehydratase